MQRSEMKAPRKKKCSVCRELFQPHNTMAKVCGVSCSIEYARNQQSKQYRKQTKELRIKAKTRQDWAREAQAEFNRYVRLRDSGLPCVSCGKPDDGSHQRHASHYRSVGACKALRYNLKNVHASCAQCNTMKSGNLLEYRINLRCRFGEDFVLWLESVNDPRRFDIEYLKRLKAVMKKKCKRIEVRRNE